MNARRMYSFGGTVVAQRESVGDKVTYLRSDHLDSVSVTTKVDGTLASRQEFDPWVVYGRAA